MVVGGGGGSTKKSRKKYAQMDLSTMGIGATSDAESCLTSPDPDSMMSPDSAMESPYEKSENTETSTATSTGSDSGLVRLEHRGTMGFYF